MVPNGEIGRLQLSGAYRTFSSATYLLGESRLILDKSSLLIGSE